MKAGILRVCLLLAWLWPALGDAQTTSLIADTVALDGQNRLIATGNVQVFYNGAELTADEVVFDQSTDQLSISGNLRLRQGADAVILASSAELSADLQNAILESARLVLDQQLQLAANEITRVDGRYTQLFQVAATSCQICAETDVPLWQIRAKRVVHDELERQLYFEGAQLRVLDVPILYLPRLRLPDPTLERATGWLVPQLKTTSLLSTGFKFPYFIRIGDDRDLTLTPYLSPNTRTLEFRYRQAYSNGDLIVRGAGTRDTILRNDTRGYLFADGTFDLQSGYTLAFDIETTTDDAYLLDYGVSNRDRLDSAISIRRATNRRYVEADIVYFESLRTGEANNTLPPIVLDYQQRLRSAQDRLGGYWDFGASLHGHRRFSDADVIGRDVASLHAQASYGIRGIFGPGLEASFTGGASADYYNVSQDSNFSDNPRARIVPFAATQLSWPLRARLENGARLDLRPVVQLRWAEVSGDSVPNDDGQRLEFDEGNLFRANRFAGTDAVESGTRATIGLSFGYTAPSRWSVQNDIARSYANTVAIEATESSGLSGERSDWLWTLSFAHPNGVELINRAVFDDSFTFAKNEARLWWRNDRLALGTSYIFLAEDVGEARTDAVSEWSTDADVVINSNWTAGVGLRYDFISDRAANAALGLTYSNECVELNLALSRRFTSSTTVTPTTDFDLSVNLKGFSTGRSASKLKRGRCGGRS